VRTVEGYILATNESAAPSTPGTDDTANDDVLKGRMLKSENFSLLSSDGISILASFCFMTLFSVLLGVLFGLLASFISKNVPTLRVHPAREMFLILLFAYLGYVVSEMIELSGIMAIFSCGMTMSYYTIYSMSQKSRKGSQLAVETIGHAAEAILFVYMGVSLFSIKVHQMSIGFSFLVLFAAFIARAISMVISYLMVCWCTEQIKLNQFAVIWFSGLVKGAIAFGLSAQISPDVSENRDFIMGTTLSIVLVSTIVLGGLMSVFARAVGLDKEKEMLRRIYASFEKGSKKEQAEAIADETGQSDEEFGDDIRGKILRMKSRAINFIVTFDRLVLQKYFGGATPEDEEREREEEEVEEHEALRIFAERHRSDFMTADHDLNDNKDDDRMIRSNPNQGRGFSYIPQNPSSISSRSNGKEESKDIELKEDLDEEI